MESRKNNQGGTSMQIELDSRLTHWATGEGRPHKGSLIDWNAYGGDGDEPPADLGCMCAQGQVLHLLGGMSPRQIKDIAGRARADFETAKLLNISISHAILLSNVNDSVDGAPSIVLTHPEKVLGPGAIGVLRMWLHFDRMTGEQWRDAWAARGTRAAESAWAARYAWAAWAARDGLAARYAWDVLDARDAAYCAVAEMAGIKFMPEHRKGEFVFLPMFGFAVPDAVPLLPENYGTAST